MNGRPAWWFLVVCLLGGPVRGADLEWRPIPDGRIAAVTPPGSGRPGFTRLPALDLGISFTNRVTDERTLTNRNLLSGSGVALGDVDGDGRCDVAFVGLEAPPQLLRNLGDWRFEDITAAAFPGVEFGLPWGAFDATGATFADVDGDGHLDFLFNALGGGTRLFRNDGRARFTEITAAAGLGSRSGATSMALADVDADGDLDLYVAHFRPNTILDQPTAKFSLKQQGKGAVVTAMNGRPTTDPDLTNRFELGASGEVIEFGEPDVLWINDGSGRFTATSWTGGTFLDEDSQPLQSAPRDWGLAARFGDINGDGRPDLYVCNDLHTPDRFWINESTPGRPVFRAIARTALRGNSMFSMGVDFGDLDRDGHVDLFTVDMLARDRAARARALAAMTPQFRLPGQFEDRVQLQRNALQWNRGDATFAEIAFFAGVESSDWSWGPIFLDVDLDGYEDILVTNGQWRDFQDSDGAERIAAAQRSGRPLQPADITRLVRDFPKLDTPNVIFRNGTGDRRAAAQGAAVLPVFREVGRDWGFGTPVISQGSALGDLDGDGDADLVMNNLLDAPGIYRNDATGPRVAVRLRGAGRNTRGIGSRIRLRSATDGALAPQRRELIAGGRYLSGDEAVVTFAAGASRKVALEVDWPSGLRTILPGVPANSLVELVEPSEGALVSAAAAHSGTFFEDVSDRLNHRHAETPAEDFARQPLLPYRLSQLGPGAAWMDLNEDGLDDLVVGAGRGGGIGVFVQGTPGRFQRMEEPMFQRPVARDLTTLLPLSGFLIAGSSNWEDGQTNGGAVRLYDLRGGRSGEAVLGVPFSVGPLAAGDVDGDGELEIFVGGRAQPGRWPEPAPSLLLKNAAGRFGVAQRFEQLGQISGACFTDLDGDGHPELALAGHWGPLRLLLNTGGTLKPWNPPVALADRRWTLDQFTGLWNSVTSLDADGDGRLDLVAGNWGWNHRGASAEVAGAGPFPRRRLYFGDLEGTGTLDLIESVPDGDREWPGREYPVWALAYPWLRAEIPTYTGFAERTVPEIFGERLQKASRLEVAWWATTLFLNRGDHFLAVPLPDQAQVAPVFGLAVADVDGDGAEDLFLAQNWFDDEPMSSRNDAGRGLWLRGDGRGGFAPLSRDGIALYGEQRAAAVSDFDADGRPDLAVTQNGGMTRLYRNAGGRPGLHVRLSGDPGNPTAVGATLRLLKGDQPGPRRETRLGAGYWSADSAVTVLARPDGDSVLEVRWPGGKASRTPVPAATRSLRVRPDGTADSLPDR